MTDLAWLLVLVLVPLLLLGAVVVIALSVNRISAGRQVPAEEIERYRLWLTSAGMRYAPSDARLALRFRGAPFDTPYGRPRRYRTAWHVGWGARRGRQVVMFELHIPITQRHSGGHGAFYTTEREVPVLVASVTLPYAGPVVEVWRDDQAGQRMPRLGYLPDPTLTSYQVFTDDPGHARRLLDGGLREVMRYDQRAAFVGHVRFAGDQLLTWYHPAGFGSALAEGQWTGRLDTDAAASMVDLLLDLLDVLEGKADRPTPSAARRLEGDQ